jgi:hypothetical protein
MGLVANTPHPAPVDGFKSIGTSSGTLMLRYARRYFRVSRHVDSTFDTYDVVQACCLLQSQRSGIVVCGYTRACVLSLAPGSFLATDIYPQNVLS